METNKHVENQSEEVVSAPEPKPAPTSSETKPTLQELEQLADKTVYIYTSYKISIIRGIPFGVCSVEMFGKYQQNSLNRGFPLTDPTPLRCAAWALLMAIESLQTIPDFQKLMEDESPIVISTTHPILTKQISSKNRDSVLKRLPDAIKSLPKCVSIIHCGTDSDGKKKKGDEKSTVTLSVGPKDKPIVQTPIERKANKKKRTNAAVSASPFANPVSLSSQDKDLLNAPKVELKDPKKEKEKMEDNGDSKKTDPMDMLRQTLEQDKIIAELFNSGARGGRKIAGYNKKK